MNFNVDKLMELKEAQARNNEGSEERKLQTKICRMENVLKVRVLLQEIPALKPKIKTEEETNNKMGS